MNIFVQYPQLKIIQKIARRRRVSVYLVGGFIRDYLLNKPNQDFDFAVEKNALKFAATLTGEIKGTCVVLDQEHGCARVLKKVKGAVLTFDFADFREDTIEGDLARRDFTINALAVDLNELDDASVIDEVIKDFKRSLKDIKDRRIKRTSIRAIREDPLRMMRAFSLKAVLGFKIELKTLNQIRKEADLLRGVSYERITEELFKILAVPQSAKVLKSMDKAGLLEKVIPQIRVMYDCTQGGYHHLDVWRHSLEAVVQLEKLFAQLKGNRKVTEYLNQPLAGRRTRASLIKLAILLHDIGKPDTRKKEGERYSFHGHEYVGKTIIKPIAKMLKLAVKERHALEDMVYFHLRPGYLSNYKQPTQRAVYRYFRDTKEEAVGILLLSLADQRATRGPLTTDKDQAHHQKICLDLVEVYFEKLKEEPVVCLLNGDDLIKYLKIKPSPLFSKILTEVQEKQSLGEVKTKKDALALAERMV